MERLARLLPFRQFGRLRHLRGIASCATSVVVRGTQPSLPLFDPPADAPVERAPSAPVTPPLPSAQPAFARVSLNSALNREPARRGPVRVYHGPSRLIMVGTVDAVCRMIDRCIAEQQGDTPVALAK